MSQKRTFTQEFKEDAVRYRLDHPELSLQKSASNLGVSMSALRRWIASAKKSNGMVEARGSGNYASEDKSGLCTQIFFYPQITHLNANNVASQEQRYFFISLLTFQLFSVTMYQ